MASMATGTAPNSAPGLLGRYELLTQLASGGMAHVYVGRRHGAQGFQRVVAIKRMRSHLVQNSELTAAFADEARIASLIQHPNVVSIHDVHEENGELFLVMDYIDGASLAELMKELRRRKERVPVDVALRIVVDVLRGLHAAHELRDYTGTSLNVVHRDATPANILIGRDGSVRITDFGIAKAISREAETQAGLIKGKFNYMAPEQATDTELDRRVDVFAMGIVLWELLVGKPLFGPKSDLDAIKAVMTAEIHPPSKDVPDLPAALDPIVMRALDRDRDGRHVNAAAFADALERAALSCGGLASATKVAETVAVYCLPVILDRETRLKEVLTGKAPPIVPPSLRDASLPLSSAPPAPAAPTVTKAANGERSGVQRSGTMPMYPQEEKTVRMTEVHQVQRGADDKVEVTEKTLPLATQADPFAAPAAAEALDVPETPSVANLAHKRKMRTIVFGVVGGAALLLVAAGVATAMREKTPEEIPTPAAQVAPPPPATTTTAAAPAAPTREPEPIPAPDPTPPPADTSSAAAPAASVATAPPAPTPPPPAPPPPAPAPAPPPVVHAPAHAAAPAKPPPPPPRPAPKKGNIVRDAPF